MCRMGIVVGYRMARRAGAANAPEPCLLNSLPILGHALPARIPPPCESLSRARRALARLLRGINGEERLGGMAKRNMSR